MKHAQENTPVAYHVSAIDKARKQAKGSWWYYASEDGKVKAKGYKTWCQRIEVVEADGRLTVGGTDPDITVTKFKNQLIGLLCNL